MKRDPWGIWFLPDAALLVIPLVAVLAAAFSGHGDWLVPTKEASSGGWIFNYQTLIAGVLALVAAIIGALMTGLFVVYQTQQAQARLAREDEQRAKVAQVMLAHTLSTFIDYLEDCLELLNEIRGHATGHRIPKTSLSPRPVLPPEVIASLYNILADIDEPPKAAIRAMLRHSQVQGSRLKGLYDSLTKPSSLTLIGIQDADAVAMDVAAVYSRAEKLIPYARGDDDTPVSANVTIRDCYTVLNRERYFGYERADFYWNRPEEERDQPYGRY